MTYKSFLKSSFIKANSSTALNYFSKFSFFINFYSLFLYSSLLFNYYS